MATHQLVGIGIHYNWVVDVMHHHIPVSRISTAEGVFVCRIGDRLQVR